MKDKTVAVIGSGVAGLSTALELAKFDISVDIIEKSDFAGGHAIRFACKATAECVKCGACLVEEKLGQALRDSRIRILTCHEGNYHSERGSGYVQQRVDRISELFRPIGLEGGRLIKKTLASNMGVEFAGALVDFEKQLLEMGPLRLKSGKE